MKCHEDIRLKRSLLLITLMVILLSANSVQSAKRTVRFTPYFDQSFKARKGKSPVSTEKDEAIMKQNFIPVGSLEVSYRISQADGPKGAKTYKYPENATKDLQKWAAKNGGDLIRITGRNVPTKGSVTWSEIKENKYTRTKYIYKSKAEFMSSYATVYRKDPAFEKKIRSDNKLLRKYYYIKGNVYSKDHLHFSAKIEYGNAIEVDPWYTEAHIARGIASMNLNSDPDALMAFTNALGMDPGNSDLYLLRGQVHLKLWNKAEAISDLEKYISLDNKDSKAHYLLGIAFERIKKNKKAVKEYRHFVQIAELPRYDSLVEDAVKRVMKIEGRTP